MPITRPGERRLAAVVAASASALLVAALAWHCPQGLYSDPGWQLKAMQQWIGGQSPTPNHVVMPLEENLAQDRLEWIVWWPPAINLIALPLVKAGMSIGASVRVIAIAGLLIGAVGWALWASLFELAPLLLIGLAAAGPLTHYATQPLFLYSAENLVYAAGPWALLLTWRTSRSQGLGPAAVAGLLLGGLYCLKYSAVLFAAGCVVYLLWKLPGAARRAVLLGAALIPIAALSMVNRHFAQTANMASASQGLHFDWRAPLFLAANPALALADADAGWRFVLLHPSHGVTHSDLALVMVGLPGGLWLLWLLSRRRSQGAESMAIVVLLVSMCGLAAAWTISQASYEARHLATASIALVPVVLLRIQQSRRIVHIAMAALFLFLPYAYGAAALVGKSLGRYAADYRMGSAGIYNSDLAERDIPRARQELASMFNPGTDIWYLPEPVTALDLPGRAIIRHADFTPVSLLAGLTYRSDVPLRVHLLLLEQSEQDGRGPVIRSSFVQVRHWEKRCVAGSHYCVWTGSTAGE